MFEKQIQAVVSYCQRFISSIKAQFNGKEAAKEDITTREKLDFLQYLYGNLMQGFVNNNEKLENKIRNFVDKKDACNGSW